MTRGAAKRTKNEALKEALRALPSDRPGLPAKDSISGVERLVSPQHDEYLIMKTTEMDSYDEPPKPKTPRRRER